MVWTDSDGKIDQKYLKLKIVIVKEVFCSLKCEKLIKNILEVLRRILDNERVLQRDVERNVVANLPGIYWRKMDRHAAYISYFKLQY